MRIAFGVVIGLSWMTIVGCSSPSRGPEGDIVEVERIEVLPTETATPAAARGPEGSAPPADEPSAGPATEDVSPAVGAGPAAEEVPATPAAN
jgi:hypothetical protein